jgi:hypothetical protein
LRRLRLQPQLFGATLGIQLLRDQLALDRLRLSLPLELPGDLLPLGNLLAQLGTFLVQYGPALEAVVGDPQGLPV